MSESFGTRRSRASGIFRPKQSLGRRSNHSATYFNDSHTLEADPTARLPSADRIHYDAHA